jgi:hypothetical protein
MILRMQFNNRYGIHSMHVKHNVLKWIGGGRLYMSFPNGIKIKIHILNQECMKY